MLQSLELELAQRHLQLFADNGNAPQHADAAYLQKGIDAYKWLARVEEAFMPADADGILAWTPEIEESIRSLYHGWLQSCAAAEETSIDQENGDQNATVAEFRQCCSLVRDWIERDEHHRVSKMARDERLAAEPW